MQTPITCPACRTQFVGDVHQIIDVGLEPALKDLFLSGYFNVVQCPSCGAGTRIGTPILYHDPDHELFMVHVPMEMGLSHNDEQQLIGQLVKRAMDRLPAEQRRGYMLQPQVIISMQTFMEKVLETEGITADDIARQRAQADLLQQLMSADKVTSDELIKTRQDEIDETFFAMLRALMESADQANQSSDYLKLMNLQAKLYRQTETGKRIERQQLAMQAFAREAKKEGLSPKLLLKHILANRDDKAVVGGLVVNGQEAFNYEFFMLLSERIERRQKSGIESEELRILRDELLELQREMEQHSREILARANTTLRDLIQAKDKAEAVRANLDRLDELFFMVVAANLAQAEEKGDKERVRAIKEVQAAVVAEAERQLPPEIRLINDLLGADDDELNQILDEHPDLVNRNLIEMLEGVEARSPDANIDELKSRIQVIKRLISTRLLT